MPSDTTRAARSAFPAICICFFHSFYLFSRPFEFCCFHSFYLKVLLGELWLPSSRADELIRFVREGERGDSVKTVLDLNPQRDPEEEEEEDEEGEGKDPRHQPPTMMQTTKFTKVCEKKKREIAVAQNVRLSILWLKRTPSRAMAK